MPAHEAVGHRVERAAEHAPRRAARPPSASACARVSISRAARRVNVSSRIRSAGTPAATSDGDARAERRRLAGPRAGEDEQVAVAVHGRSALLGVQLLKPVRGVGGLRRDEHPFAEHYDRFRTTSLIFDLLERMGPTPRGPYAEVLEAWRTSCPRLPVWEDVNDRGFIARRRVQGAPRSPRQVSRSSLRAPCVASTSSPASVRPSSGW